MKIKKQWTSIKRININRIIKLRKMNTTLIKEYTKVKIM